MDCKQQDLPTEMFTRKSSSLIAIFKCLAVAHLLLGNNTSSFVRMVVAFGVNPLSSWTKTIGSTISGGPVAVGTKPKYEAHPPTRSIPVTVGTILYSNPNDVKVTAVSEQSEQLQHDKEKNDMTQPAVSRDYEEPDDAVIRIQPRAMQRLRELRQQQCSSIDVPLILRMGVRNGGCSGMSYVMDFDKVENINEEDDTVDVYRGDNIQCVVDSKSLLYLYGLELDYSDELVGGGFKFYNPSAEETCGCGSSFAV